ncbi:dihydroorotase [Thermocrinis sp.]
MKTILLKGGRILDPSQSLDLVGDLLIEDGRISAIDKSINFPYAEVYNVSGCIVCPSFVDVHVHLRDPGQTYKEDIESGSRCAVAGGFTTVLCMPNTKPPIDSPEVAQYILEKSKKVGFCQVLPAGALTKGRKGQELTDFYALREAGCPALTDDGAPLMDSRLMEMALKLARQLDLLVMNHCEDDRLSMGHINEGYVSSLLGIAHRSPSAEDILVARDCILSYHTKGKIHIQHISSKLSVEIVRSFKEKGAPVSCEVNPYHLLFEEEEVLSSGSNAKVNPPLRKEEDRMALLEALKDGTIDCIATDHAPHAKREKGSLESAMPGMIGLQTALPMGLELVRKEVITLEKLIYLLSISPAKLLGVERGIKRGNFANIAVFSMDEEWVLDEKTNLSKSQNTPLWGKTLKGRVRMTIWEGRIVYNCINKGA